MVLAWKHEDWFFVVEQNDRTANLSLAGKTLVTRPGFVNDHLDLQLDTGANVTRLYPRFHRDYAAYLRLFGHTETIDIAKGRTDRRAVALPEVSLIVGGSARSLRPAHVFPGNPTSNESCLHGAIGFNFLSHAATVTLDFRAMRITMTGDGA